MHHAPQKYRNNKGTGGGGERETEWAKTSKEQGELGAQRAAAQRTKFQHLGTKCGRYAGSMVSTRKGGEEGWGVGQSEGRQPWKSPEPRRDFDSYLMPALVQFISGLLKALTSQSKSLIKHTGILTMPHLAVMSHNLRGLLPSRLTTASVEQGPTLYPPDTAHC